MPIDTNLPTAVRLYLELIGMLTSEIVNIDSCTPEAKLIHIEIEYYLKNIRVEMEKLMIEIGA